MGLVAMSVPGVITFSGMRVERLSLHVFSKHLQFLDYEEMAKAASKVGFDGVDLTVRPGGHVFPERVEQDLPRAVKAIRGAGLKAEMMTTAITDPEDEISRNVLRVAADQGIRFYRTGWLRHPEDVPIPESLRAFKAQVQGLAELNKELGIHGAYQNHAGNYVGASLWEVWELIKDADPEWLGCQYDIRHANIEGGLSWQQGLRLIRPFINTIVLKDVKWESRDGKWQPVNTPIGEGMVDFSLYFSIIQSYGLNCPVSMHYEYALGGAERGSREIDIPVQDVLAAMKRDIQKVRETWQNASSTTGASR